MDVDSDVERLVSLAVRDLLGLCLQRRFRRFRDLRGRFDRPDLGMAVGMDNDIEGVKRYEPVMRAIALLMRFVGASVGLCLNTPTRCWTSESLSTVEGPGSSSCGSSSCTRSPSSGEGVRGARARDARLRLVCGKQRLCGHRVCGERGRFFVQYLGRDGFDAGRIRDKRVRRRRWLGRRRMCRELVRPALGGIVEPGLDVLQEAFQLRG